MHLVGGQPGHLDDRPAGASEPRRTLIPPSVWIGRSMGCTTTPSGPGGSSSARFSAIVAPVTVMHVAVQQPGVEQHA